jgi:protein-tyrosine kinase
MDRLEKAMEKARQLREANAFIGLEAAARSYAVNSAAGAVSPASNFLPLASAEIADEQLEKHRIIAHRLRSPEADVFRILRTRVLQIMNKSGFKTLAITSPRYGDGKTTIALNLAVSIALDMKQTVLIVDLDLRKPTLWKYLGLKQDVGLTDHLLNNVPIAQCLTRLSFDRLSVLPAGMPLDNSSETLGSHRMVALARELKSRYTDRLVIYDMPPVLAQDDSIAFLPHVDATLMVLRDGVTRANEIKTCFDRLADVNIIGTVLNNAVQTYG